VRSTKGQKANCKDITFGHSLAIVATTRSVVLLQELIDYVREVCDR